MTQRVIYLLSVCLFLLVNIICLLQQNVLFYTEIPVKFFDHYLYFGVDGISTIFMYLTSFLCPLCILYSYGNRKYAAEYTICIFCVEILLLLVSSVLDLFFFYIFFETILIPFFLLIGLRGKRMRRLHAAYLLFLYTVFGSIFMLIGIISIFNEVGTVNMQILWYHDLSLVNTKFLWWSFLLSFAVKIPMIPLHIWLPEAHVESPTEGSVILAGVLLKVGLYGFIRVLIQILYDTSVYYSSLVSILAIISIFYASLTTLRQIDIKRIIAYSSIAHMNVCVLGMLSFKLISFCGSVFLMFGHGIVSSGLFFAIGILYDRFGTKVIKYYSGVVNNMPIFSILFFFFVLGNISMPGTINFVGEFLILCGLFESYSIVSIYATSFGILLRCIYTMWVYNKVAFGGVIREHVLRDINYREFNVLFPLVVYTVLLGLFPGVLLDMIYLSVCYTLPFAFQSLAVIE